MKITVARAYQAISKLNKQRTPQGQEIPELLQIKGSVGTKVYHLKKDIKDVFKAHFERIDDLLQDKQALFQELQDLEEEKNEERFKDIKEEVKEINEQLNEIEQEEEELKLTKGKILIEDIEDQVAPEHWEEIDFAIEMNGTADG